MRCPRLFDRFYKADPSRTGGSSGLGLAIASEHAALLGASLRARQRPGGGLVFALTLPVTEPLPASDLADTTAAEDRRASDPAPGPPRDPAQAVAPRRLRRHRRRSPSSSPPACPRPARSARPRPSHRPACRRSRRRPTTRRPTCRRPRPHRPWLTRRRPPAPIATPSPSPSPSAPAASPVTLDRHRRHDHRPRLLLPRQLHGQRRARAGPARDPADPGRRHRGDARPPRRPQREGAGRQPRDVHGRAGGHPAAWPVDQGRRGDREPLRRVRVRRRQVGDPRAARARSSTPSPSSRPWTP